MSGAGWRSTPLLVCTGLAVGGHLMLALLGWRGPVSAHSGPSVALNVRMLQAAGPPVSAELASSIDAAAQESEQRSGAVSAQLAASQPDPAPGPRFDERAYLSRRELTVGPAMKVEVPLVWPPEGVLAGHYEDVAVLFIDEYGQVQRVFFEGNALPQLLQIQAQEAFFASRFSPGELNGRASKSRIRVQVAFDSPGHVRRGGSGL